MRARYGFLLAAAFGLCGCSGDDAVPAPRAILPTGQVDGMTVPGDWHAAQEAGFTACQYDGNFICNRAPAGRFFGVAVRAARVRMDSADNFHEGGVVESSPYAEPKPRDAQTYRSILLNFDDGAMDLVRTALTGAGWAQTRGRRGYERWVSPDHKVKAVHSGAANGSWLSLEPFDPTIFGEEPVPPAQR
jgi:hypothetical protein